MPQAYSYTIRVDRDRNVVYITQSGLASADDLERLKHDFVTALEGVHRGFSIVNDQRKLEPIAERARPVAAQLVRLTDQAGASRVIRVLPEDFVSTATIARTLVAARGSYQNVNVNTLEEAEALLDEK